MSIAKFIQRAIDGWLPMAVWAIAASVASACPNCKLGFHENGQQGESLARGFELSIYLMTGMPLLILSGLGLLFYIQIRSAQAHSPLETSDPLPSYENRIPAFHGSEMQ